ncbi:MAG: DUF2231 domain-containing protein [Pseudomonadota bacterium]|nr:DUF2231 domain-containing protein [Pseudomonadota bacterium]
MVIEIIPNWHPILVHFTIALLSVSVVLFLAESFIRKWPLHTQLVTVARWNLWLGSLAAIATVIAGFDAFNSVPHGSEHQHLAMLDHRNWGLGTAVLFIFLAAWSLTASLRGKADFRKSKNLVFVSLMVVAGLMLSVTGYKGAELVYRQGLGVIPMSVGMEAGHNHSHSGTSPSHEMERGADMEGEPGHSESSEGPHGHDDQNDHHH